MDATRISDGKYVMLKKLLEDEGPHELQLNRLFSSEPLTSNPRNHCAPLLDVIELPNDPPIMVHSQLRTYYNPPFHTFGEFVAFFGQICDVRCSFSPYILIAIAELLRGFNSCTRITSLIGICFFLRSYPCLSFCLSGIARQKTSCLIRQECIRSHSIPW